jgi:hypothetical protein
MLKVLTEGSKVIIDDETNCPPSLTHLRSRRKMNNDRYIFRGKRADNGEWIEGSLLQWPDSDCEICAYAINDKDNIPTLFKYTVFKKTVGQCTGLKDKNGKLIFEGDITKFINSSRSALVSFNNGSFIRKYGDVTFTFECTDLNTVELIGNIFDNPELISEGSNE